MEDKIVNVLVNEDKSVDRLLKRTSKKLKKSFNESSRSLNELKLNQKKSFWAKALSIMLNAISVSFIIITTFICVLGIINKSKGIPPTLAGYQTMIIESHSMEQSGLYKGNSVVVKYVNANSLREGDVIAFYVYDKAYENIKPADLNIVSGETLDYAKTHISLKEFLGFQSTKIIDAVNHNSTLVIHHIRDIYQDDNGYIWFSTYGSSNGYTDPWLVSEELIVGTLDTSTSAKIVGSLVEFLNNPIGLFLLILIPLAYLIYSIISELVYKRAILKLQKQVLNGERLLTDIICIKHKVGYGLARKKKLEVLAMAPIELKTTYLSLLWENGSAPNSIRKHYLRKNIYLSIYAEYNELNRSVALMYKDGVNEKAIASYYLERKNVIAEKEARYNSKLKKIKLTKFKK